MRVAGDHRAFLSRAAGRLRPEPPGPSERHSNPRGDHDLEFDGTPLPSAVPLKPAAVLVPVVTRDEGATVLLTERAPDLRHHSGQIAFPGGKVDFGETPLEAALREAEEEIGLERRHVRPLGYLDPYLSSSGYHIMPLVGAVSPALSLTPNRLEVAEVFEVPLAFLMDPENHELHAREWRGRCRQYYAIPFQARYIWGVTAGILRNLYERLYRP
jgi:8-oxo-dGTP pyrophosphatase MutT (NUDIX family)